MIENQNGQDIIDSLLDGTYKAPTGLKRIYYRVIVGIEDIFSPRHVKRRIKYAWQRLVRGWDDSELWNLDYTIAEFILPRLIRYKEISISYGAKYTEEEWSDILDKMIHSFQVITANEGVYYDLGQEEFELVQEGLKVFAEHYTQLWD